MKAKQLVAPCIASAMLATLPFTPLATRHQAMTAVEPIDVIEEAAEPTNGAVIWIADEDLLQVGIGPATNIEAILMDSTYLADTLLTIGTTDYVTFGDDVVTVDCRDGSVTFGVGVTTNEASLAFWRYVEHQFPEMFERKAVAE